MELKQTTKLDMFFESPEKTRLSAETLIHEIQQVVLKELEFDFRQKPQQIALYDLSGNFFWHNF